MKEFCSVVWFVTVFIRFYYILLIYSFIAGRWPVGLLVASKNFISFVVVAEFSAIFNARSRIFFVRHTSIWIDWIGVYLTDLGYTIETGRLMTDLFLRSKFIRGNLVMVYEYELYLYLIISKWHRTIATILIVTHIQITREYSDTHLCTARVKIFTENMKLESIFGAGFAQTTKIL